MYLDTNTIAKVSGYKTFYRYFTRHRSIT